MASTDLLVFCEKKNIEVLFRPFLHNESCSIPLSREECAIGINDRNMTEAERKTCLAHKVGHCETGSFYFPYSPIDLRSRHEHRANMWAIKNILPKCKMKRAMRSGITEVWQLAEHFTVTEPLIRFALWE